MNYDFVDNNGINYIIIINSEGDNLKIEFKNYNASYKYSMVKNGSSTLFINSYPKELINFINKIIFLEIFT